MPDAPLFLVDGFNVLHAVVLEGRDRRRWWSRENQERVVRLVERFDGGEAWVVFDAARPGGERCTSDRVRIEYAPSADDAIVGFVGQAAPMRRVVVVSSDRALQDRARHRGSERLSPWQFVERCGDRPG